MSAELRKNMVKACLLAPNEELAKLEAGEHYLCHLAAVYVDFPMTHATQTDKQYTHPPTYI